MQTQILGLLTPLMALGFAATFIVFWWAGRMERYVLGFGLGYVFFAAGFLVTHLLPGDAFYLFHTTQALYSIGTTIYFIALCERAGVKLNLAGFALIYVTCALVLALAISLSNDVAPRLVLINMGYGAMFTFGAATLLPAMRRSWIDVAIMAVLAFSAADLFIRPTLTLLFERSIPAQDYQASLYYSLIGLVLGVKSVASAMVLIGATIVDLTASIKESGSRDALTGLNNRGSFEESMRTLLPKAQLEGRPLSLVVADIDHFKQVNDIWGHQAGDAAIQEFARLIQGMVRGCDMTARIGGEEFCIAVWDCEEDAGQRLAERIRVNFAEATMPQLGEGMRLTASFGVVQVMAGEDYAQLFARADAALYRAKQAGRNMVVASTGDIDRQVPGEEAPVSRAARSSAAA